MAARVSLRLFPRVQAYRPPQTIYRRGLQRAPRIECRDYAAAHSQISTPKSWLWLKGDAMIRETPAQTVELKPITNTGTINTHNAITMIASVGTLYLAAKP